MTPHARVSALVALLSLLAVSGCAHAPMPAPAGATGRRALAVLPLENLSGRTEYGTRFSRLVWSCLGRTGRFDIVDPGEVDAALSELRIRSSGALTRDQLLNASTRLKVRWIVAGTLLECGAVRTPDGEVPTFALALRLIDGHTGRVAWTDLRARSGEDRETVFGWGREVSLERLAEATTRVLVQGLVIPDSPDSPDSLSTTEGTP